MSGLKWIGLIHLFKLNTILILEFHKITMKALVQLCQQEVKFDEDDKWSIILNARRQTSPINISHSAAMVLAENTYCNTYDANFSIIYV